MSATQKPAALLDQMAGRVGQKLTKRDAVALRLAAATLRHQADEIARHMGIYRAQLYEVVDAKSRIETMESGLRALLEVLT